MAILDNLPFFNAVMERFARTANIDGLRSYQSAANRQSGPLCDEHGHLIVRSIGPAGFSGIPTVGATLYAPQIAGSAPAYNNLGFVGNTRVMLSPDTFLADATGSPTVGRMFGYSDKAGFIQLHLKDEPEGANPPELGDVPEVIIPIGAGQNFVFSDYLLIPDTVFDATYLTFSSTGPTFTPDGDHIWFYFAGML